MRNAAPDTGRFDLEELAEFRPLQRAEFAYAETERYLAALAEHTHLLAAIEARDVEEADRTARFHVRAGQAQRLKILFEGRRA